MTRTRGRPIIPMPIHPERVISRAVKAGLSATIRLQRDISNKTTKKYYERSKERWSIRQQVYQISKERSSPDFTHISKAEALIRDDTRLMFYERAAKYGFTEVIRQKNTDDTVDPLNQRFNACGRVVRENSEILFPLPNPVSFGTYTRRDGKGRNKYRRAGYEGSSFGPKVILAHPDLPSLDFGDAVRSHNEFLATFCAIHNVPVRETTKYSNLFFLLARPYLEYLYSEFKYGKANFQKGVNWALRQVKELILEAGYRPTMYEKRTVTKTLEFKESDKKEENKRFFERSEEEAREFYRNHPAVTELGRLRGRLGKDEKKEDDSIFTVKDVDHIRKKAAKRARVAGSIMHRRIADLFPSPWHLNDVIFAGDKYASSSGYIIVSEVPIQTENDMGKIDLILCERSITEDGKQALGKPVLALEIKTRLGQSWYFKADYKESEVRPDGSPLQRVVCSFPLSDNPLSDDLWDTIVNSTPTPSARKQLDTYCQALTELYENTIQQELGQVLRGVVVIDSASDVFETRKILERLIVHAYESVKNRVRRLKRTIFTPVASNNNRIVLVLDEQPGPRKKRERVIEAPWGPIYTPFKSHKKTKRNLMLYLIGHSSTSAGLSAAWNARYYHGLNMLYEMNRSYDNTEFVWMDLANEFIEPRLAEARLRLRPRGYSEEEIAKVQPEHIREFFENIKVKGYLDDILDFLYRDGGVPSFDLKIGKKRKVIVITGADTLRDATPTSHRERFFQVIDHLLSCLPDDEKTTVVWFDASVPFVEKAIPYSSRTLLPFYETSSLGEVVSEIVWNLPIASRGALQPKKWGLPVIGDSPMHDDIRVIVRHTPTDLQMELTHVPILRAWSKRFRNKGTGLVTREREIDDFVPDRNLRHRMKLLSLTMIPWLVKLWPKEILIEDAVDALEEQFSQLDVELCGGAEPLTFEKTTLTEPPSQSPSLLDLVIFRLPDTMDAKSFQELTVGKINSQRLYRSPRELKTQPLQQVPTPHIKEELLDIETEEIEQEWLFGVKFESDGDELVPWWIVVQDPTHTSRMLVGCFTDRPPDKDRFHWTENRQEMMKQSSLDDILSFPQTIIIGRKNEDGMEVWSSRDGSDAVHEGVLEVRGQGRSTVSHLRAIRQTITDGAIDRPSSTVRPSEAFYTRMVDALRRHLEAATSPTPVRLLLEMVDDVCQVSIVDEDEVMQEVTIEYTADLISLLRWPMTKGGPMFTDSGGYVVWSVFDDIDYGGLDFIRPYVTYTAARKTPQELPERVSQFFDEAVELSVSIVHDISVCPCVSGEKVDHGACWRITLPPRCPTRVRKQLDRSLTGEEVNGLLAPGRIYTGRLYTFDIKPPIVSEKDESIVFHEERYIRLLLRNLGLRLKRLRPGTFLKVKDQQWRVSITWDGSSFIWEAQSVVSDLFFRGGNQTVELVHGNSAQEECERLFRFITSFIQPGQIVKYDHLKESVLSALKDRGYSETSPPCELRFIEQSDTVCRYGVFLIEGSTTEPLETYSVEAKGSLSSDAILIEIEMGLDASVCNIVNTEVFLKTLVTWMKKNIPDNGERSEESERWTVALFLSEDFEDGVIHWTAEYEGFHRDGVIHMDLREIRGHEEEVACENVRSIFRIEVVKELQVISNLDDVLENQVPEVIRELRRGAE